MQPSHCGRSDTRNTMWNKKKTRTHDRKSRNNKVMDGQVTKRWTRWAMNTLCFTFCHRISFLTLLIFCIMNYIYDASTLNTFQIRNFSPLGFSMILNNLKNLIYENYFLNHLVNAPVIIKTRILNADIYSRMLG